MRAIERLTENKIRTLTKPGHYPDGAGLYLQITERGTRSWSLRFRMNGKTREAGLGGLRELPLVTARRKASEYRTLIAQGIDPIEHVKLTRLDSPNSSSTAPLFADYAEQCIVGWEADWKNPKLALLWRATLRTYAFPIIGDLPVDEIETRHMLEILTPIWRTKSETASRVRERCERILAAASVEGLRTKPNVALWKGHLSEARGLGKKKPSKPMPSMPYAQLPAFLVELRAIDSVPALALEFLVLTTLRSGAVRLARWPEIDIDARLWSIPAASMKMNRDHVVPLCDRAVEILEKVKPLRDFGGQYVFPGTKSGRPLSDMTLSALVRRMGYRCVPHGFRSTFKTFCEERTNHANAVIEATLAHIVGDKTESVYFRGNYLDKRRALLNDWNAFCMSEPEVKVLPMRSAGGRQ